MKATDIAMDMATVKGMEMVMDTAMGMEMVMGTATAMEDDDPSVIVIQSI